MLPVVLSPAAAHTLQKLAPDEHLAMRAALRQLPAAFGRPHTHAGLGVRQLAPGVYEVRAGLQWRALFLRRADSLEVRLIGHHDDIRRWLKNR